VDDVRYLAGVLCERKPNATNAVQVLRRSTGRARPKQRDDDGDLVEVLAAAIDQWRAKYPEANDNDVCRAIARVFTAMRGN